MNLIGYQLSLDNLFCIARLKTFNTQWNIALFRIFFSCSAAMSVSFCSQLLCSNLPYLLSIFSFLEKSVLWITNFLVELQESCANASLESQVVQRFTILCIKYHIFLLLDTVQRKIIWSARWISPVCVM